MTTHLSCRKRKRTDGHDDENEESLVFLNVFEKKPRRKERETSPSIYYCTKENCLCSFRDETSLDKHLKTHEIDFKYLKCIHAGCNRVFETEEEIETHYRRAHRDDLEKKFVCDVAGCNASYTNRFGLWSHKQRIHNPENVVCSHDGCGRIFKTKKEMLIHVKNKHVDKSQKKIYDCPYHTCEKKFSTKQGLESHILRHQGKCQYACNMCDKKFVTVTELKIHLKKHTKTEVKWGDVGQTIRKNYHNSLVAGH